MPKPASPTVAGHFARRTPEVRRVYDRILAAARRLGPVEEDPKKTSIHLVRKTAFAGIATRRDALILTLKSASDIPSPRVKRRERASANRWHVEIRLEKAAEVDRELTTWLNRAHDLAG
jgi:hypothetical protein